VPTASEALADFAVGVRFGDLPAAVVDKAKCHLLDLIGVALASASMPFGRMALDTATAESGDGNASVIGFDARLPPAWAALVNGALAHGIDFDDTHQEAVVHVSASVVPAALAAAEAADADGPAFLGAMAVGLETAVRLGLVAPGAFHARGFHPTGVCGAFAAALVAGKLLDLDAARLASALGLANSVAAGSMEFLTDGSWAKRLHAGWAAHGGMVAARLAERGFIGPRECLEGRFGLYRSHLGDGGWSIERLTRGLGSRWELLDIALKPYPCCHFTHAFIDCAAELRRKGAIVPDAIRGIECFVPPGEIPVVCEPAASKRRPQTDYDAKFSLPYTVACMLVRGHVDVRDFGEDAVRDPEVLRVAERVVCTPEDNPDFPRRFPGRLRIALADGRIEEWDEPVNRGSAERPLEKSKVREKFRQNARLSLADERIEPLLSAIENVERSARLRDLGALFRPGGG
jgi:2-methylcitrate dehydratase PrpD